MKAERIQELLEDTRYVLTKWQRGFLESILSQVKLMYKLSDNQLAILEEIEKNNDDNALKSREEWKSAFLKSEEIRETWDVVARYYNRAGNYFSSTIDSYIKDSSFIPSREQYIKICENKYSQKVVKSHFSEPKYPKGEVVKFRKSVSPLREFEKENGGWFRPKGDSFAVVLETDALPVRKAANSSKVYRVLPFGSSKAYYVHESDIKRAKRAKR